jgi:hypothetical protein
MGWFDIAVAGLVILLSLYTWRRCFSTISDIPGLFVASFTRLWHMMIILNGDQKLEAVRLHEKHGKDRTLRVSQWLAYIKATLYGFRTTKSVSAIQMPSKRYSRDLFTK